MSEFTEILDRYWDRDQVPLNKLAQIVNYDRGNLSKIARGLRPPSALAARLLDRHFGADGEIERAAERARRRPAPAPPRRPVAPELAAYFSGELAGHYLADRYLGPGQLIGTALAQDKLLAGVANDAEGDVRRELWAVAAGFGALLGWLFQDSGDLSRSATWHNTMIERAHRTNDGQLVAFALHCKSMLLADQGDGPGVLDLTGAALAQRRRLAPKVAVLLLQQKAHGLALARPDAAADCARLLDEAEALVERVDDDYPWGGACKAPGYIGVQRATIATRLGRAREAIGLWDEVLPSLSPGRDLGVFTARRARAHADAGEPDRAVQLAAEAAPVAVSTGSARITAELAAVRQAMTPWRGQPPWRAIEDVLAGLPRQRRR